VLAVEKKIFFALSDIWELRIGFSKRKCEVILPVAGDRKSILGECPHSHEGLNWNATLKDLDFRSDSRQIIQERSLAWSSCNSSWLTRTRWTNQALAAIRLVSLAIPAALILACGPSSRSAVETGPPCSPGPDCAPMSYYACLDLIEESSRNSGITPKVLALGKLYRWVIFDHDGERFRIGCKDGYIQTFEGTR